MTTTNAAPEHDYRAEPLRWSEGMLLSPQHFQQNDIYWQEQTALRSRWMRPYAWGLWDLELDETALRQGVVQITHLEAMLPDGMAVQFPAAKDDDGLAPLKVADHPALSGLGGRLRVHLAVPKRLRGAASERADLRRFRPVPGATAVDENTGGDEIEIDRLRACLSLLPADKLTGGHEQIPLLEIERAGNEFQATAYHPPLLRVRAADFLHNTSVLSRVETLLRDLNDRASSQAGDAEGQRLLAALTSALPPLRLMVQSGEVHPFDLYLALAGLLGHVAQIDSAPLAAMLVRPYDHQNLEPGFDGMLSSFGALLKRVRVGYRAHVFKRIESGVFEIALGEDWHLDELYIEARGSDRRMIERWMHDAHIGDAALHMQLERRRVPGAGRRIVRDGLARRLPVADSGLLYTIENGSQADDHGRVQPLIRAGTRLRVSGATDATQPDELQLYCRQPAAAPAASR
jgi:type VI secretion system protein ImpJ